MQCRSPAPRLRFTTSFAGGGYASDHRRSTAETLTTTARVHSGTDAASEQGNADRDGERRQPSLWNGKSCLHQHDHRVCERRHAGVGDYRSTKPHHVGDSGLTWQGHYSIIAAQGTLATNNNYSFAFVDGTLTVTPAAGATTTLSVSPTTVMYGDPAVLTAVVGPPSGATGTVSFHEGTTLLGTASLDGSATAVLSVSTLNAGTHTITATYNGDVNFPPSTSNPVTLTVTQRTGAGGGAALTVTVNDASRTTTEANPPFSHTVAGELVNGDTYATAVTGTPTYSTTAGTTAGTFADHGIGAFEREIMCLRLFPAL